MKVLLVASNSLLVSPYVKTYCKLLQDQKIDFDVVEKQHIIEKKEESSERNFTWYYKSTRTPFGKIVRFHRYAEFVKKTIENGEYDRVVLFSIVDAAFCYRLISKNKKVRVIVDVRDYNKTVNYPFIKRWFTRSLVNSDMVVISSAKFQSWLPKISNIHVMHNLTDLEHIQGSSQALSREKINIGYFGGIGYYKQNVALVNAFRDSDQVFFTYRGKYPAHDNIRDYCLENGIKNVFFYGKYNNDEKYSLYNDIDFINAVYGDDSLVVKTALPNKLYDCICYKIPIIASKNTYLGDIITENKIGFAVDITRDNLAKELEIFIQNFDCDNFNQTCDLLLDKIKKEQDKTTESLLDFFRGRMH